MSPYYLLTNNPTSSFNHPLLEFPHPNAMLKPIWVQKSEMWKRINKILAERYQTTVAIKTHDFRTVQSMGIREGDTVYARIYASCPKLLEFIKMMPNFVPCKVLKILAPTVLLLENIATEQRFTRAIRDVFMMKSLPSWPNHYLESGRRALQKRAHGGLGGSRRSHGPIE